MQCAFCGRDPYHYVDNGCGMEAVAVVCCEAACAVSDKGNSDDAEYITTIGELRELAAKISALQARNDAYTERYGEIFQDADGEE